MKKKMDGKPLRLLIVEDNENDALLLLRQLRQDGYNPDYEIIDTAAQVREALDKKDWDIVVSDYVLPEFNGLETLHILQDIGKDIPCLIVSGKIGEETAVAAMRAGARDYIMKDELKRLGPAIDRELKEAEARRNQRRMEKKLKETQARLTRKLLDAQEAERTRIARELHDDTAQSLSIISLEMDSLISSGQFCSEEDAARISSLKTSVDRVIEDVRRFSHELHPALLDQLGLLPALEQLANETAELGNLEIDLDIRGEEWELSRDAELSLFRITQESLNNIRKHARATRVVITLHYLPDGIKLSISDNGQGFCVNQVSEAALSRGSLGLLSMRERARLINADFNIDSSPGRGTSITIEVGRQDNTR